MVSDIVIKPENLPTVQTATLDNGLRHVHICLETTATFSARIGLRAGHVHGSVSEMGVAHFLEHMVFNGTDKYPDKDQLSDLIDFVGGSHNAATSWNSVSYYVNLLAKDANKALDYLSQIIIHPLLREEDFVREKQIITDEAKGRLSSIAYLSWSKLNQMYFTDPRWHTSAVGSPDSVQQITLQNIKDFYQRTYYPANAVLVTAGPQDFAAVTNMVKGYFGSWSSNYQDPLAFPAPAINSKAQFANFTTELAEQTTIRLIKPSVTEEETTNYAIDIADAVIGGESFSRLFKYLREKQGLSYGLGTSITTQKTYGTWQFAAGLDEVNIAKFAESYREVIDNLLTNPISDHELRRAKNDLLASTLFDCEKASALTDLWLSEYVRSEPYSSMTDLVSGISEVKLQEVQDWVQSYVESPSTILVTSKNPVAESDLAPMLS